MRVNVSEVEVAWCAGLFAGEGCVGRIVSRTASGVYEYLCLQISMYDEQALTRFARTLGLRCYSYWHKQRNHICWKVCARGRTAERALAVMWPHLAATAKGQQTLEHTLHLGISDWITGKKTGVRPQLQLLKRGRRVRHSG